MFVGAMEEASEIGLDAQRVEVIAAGFVQPHLLGGAVGVEPGGSDLVGDKPVKGPVPVAEVDVVGIRIRGSPILAPLDHEEVLRLGDIEGAQNQGVQKTEHYRIGADAQCQGQYSHAGKPRRFAQHPQPEAEILEDAFDGLPAGRFMALDLVALISTELDAGAALRLSARNARRVRGRRRGVGYGSGARRPFRDRDAGGETRQKRRKRSNATVS